MSTWISRAISFLALAAIAACAGTADVNRRPPDRILVAENVVVAGPPGYCVDPDATRDRGGSVFVLLGSCASIAGRADLETPLEPGLLTVVVADARTSGVLDDASPDLLDAFFRSPVGRASLSSDGRSDSIEILETRAENGIVFVRARDLGDRRPRWIHRESWRTLFDLNGHLVTAAVTGLESAPLTPDAGLETLAALTATLMEENRPDSLQ